MPAASVLYGVRAIEKHYTFNKELPLSADHWLSLDEGQLKQLVDDVRELEQALGNGRKVRLDCETPAYKFARRSVVAATDIPKGQVFTEDNLALKRPGTGLPPEFFPRFLGRTAAHPIAADALLTMEDAE